MIRHSLFAAALVAIATSTGCQATQSPAPDTRAADEAAIRKADEDWSIAAATTKDLDKTVGFYADGALVMPPNGVAVTTKNGMRDIWKGYLESPGFAGGWKVVRAEAARSGDIGYASGTWDFRWKDAAGTPAGDHGKFTEIWKKQADGSWKCVADIWNSDLPLPEPGKK